MHAVGSLAPMDADAASFPPELVALLEQGGIDLSPERRTVHEALLSAITGRYHAGAWSGDASGWVVEVQIPQQHIFFGQTLEEALAWCLAWMLVTTPTNPPAAP